MLEQLRRQSGSFVIWLIFAIIIAAFVLFFGPQSSGDLGCGASADDFVIEIDGKPMGIHAWRFSMNSQRSGLPAAQRRTLALDALVGRTLLANAARKAGYDVAEDQVVENLKRGELYILGLRLPKEAIFENGVFDYEKLDYQARARGLKGIDHLISQQRDEILANITRALLVKKRVSKEEAEQRFIQQNTTVTAKYAKFDVATYQNAMQVSGPDIDAYVATHESEIKELFEARKKLYENVRPQIRVRHIMIKKPGGEEDAAAKERAEDVKKQLEGGADFAAVAKASSDDERSKMRGGDLGWRPVDSIGFGKELSEAAKSLEKDVVSGLVETKAAFHILRIDGKREGALGYDDVKRELAEDKARSFYAKEAARRDAEQARAQLAAGRSLEDLFKVKPADEGPKTGSLTRDVRDIPASWGPVGQAAAKLDPKDADPATKAPAPPIATPAVTVPAPELQTLGPVSRRGEMLPGLGAAPELSKALFKELEIGKVADKVYEVGSGFVLVRVESRDQADLENFDGQQITIGGDFQQCSFPLQMIAVTRSSDELPAQCLALKKGVDSLQSFLFNECSKAAKEGRIRVNTSFLSQESSGFKYSPCGSLDFQAALVQVMSLSGALQ